MNEMNYMRPASIIGVPTDIGAGTRGSSMGPEALRVAGLVEAVARYGCAVKDCGNPARPTPCFHPFQVSATCRK
jgi:arginase